MRTNSCAINVSYDKLAIYEKAYLYTQLSETMRILVDIHIDNLHQNFYKSDCILH